MQAVLDTSNQGATRYLRESADWSAAWQSVAGRMETHLDLNPEQAAAFGAEVLAVFDRYQAMTPGPGIAAGAGRGDPLPTGHPRHPGHPRCDGNPGHDRQSGTACAEHPTGVAVTAQATTSLGHRFWRLFGASATSNLAVGIGLSAAPLLATTLTTDPVLISGMSSLLFLPWLLFALPGGALVDRMDRRRAMAAANACRANPWAALGFVLLGPGASIGLLYVVVFALGTAEVIYDSAARAILPQVVAPDGLDRGNSWLTGEETVGQIFAGAPLGAALFALGAAIPFLTNAAGFALAAGLILTLSGSYRPPRTEQPPCGPTSGRGSAGCGAIGCSAG